MGLWSCRRGNCRELPSCVRATCLQIAEAEREIKAYSDCIARLEAESKPGAGKRGAGETLCSAVQCRAEAAPAITCTATPSHGCSRTCGYGSSWGARVGVGPTG